MLEDDFELSVFQVHDLYTKEISRVIFGMERLLDHSITD